MPEGQFNIRVYGIYFNDKGELLLSDEYVLDTYMTKFPGGGLEFGEGPEDCLKREAIEEFEQEIVIKTHFYTTHYFQPTLYYENMQLISIYYIFDFVDPIKFKISDTAYDFEKNKNGEQSFRFEKLATLQEVDFTFPIDKHVLQLLKNKE